MNDDDQAPKTSTIDEAASQAQVLDEQQARIAALRAAVLSGRVDEETFDYAAFFAPKAESDPPSS